MERAYRGSTRVLGVLTAVVGIALIVSTLARGGGPTAVGLVIGVLFTVIGVARLYLARRHSGGSR